jgi:choice-of-anchor B domain-containing protein
VRTALRFLPLLILAPVAPAAAQGSGFTATMAISGDDLLIGRPGSAFTPAGAIHMYRRAGDGTWRETGSFSGEGVRSGEGFGASLSMDGNRVAVGAPGHGAGAVFIFERRGTGFGQVAKLTAPEEGDNQGFAVSVALRGNTLLVGAPGRDSLAGVVYAFQRDGQGNWSAATRVAAGTETWDRLGMALALEGELALIGMPGPPPFPNIRARPRAGAALVFRQSPDGWTEVGRLEPPAADSVRTFGSVLRLGDGLALVGVQQAARNAGSVYEFRAEAGGWREAGRLVPATPEANARFGATLALDGGTLAVGAPGAGPRAGAVHLFERAGDGWTPGPVLTVADLDASARLATTVVLSGRLLAAGAPGAGSAVVFAREGNTAWRPSAPIEDTSTRLDAVTGGMVRCDSTASQASGFGCSDVDLLSFLPIRDIGGGSGVQLNDIWGWTDPETNREYALVGRTNGTAFVDVTDPANPIFVGDLPMTPGARAASWRDIKVHQDHAFIVADNSGQHGMQVFDLTRLRNPGALPATFAADTVYSRIASAHNIAINEGTGFAYTIGNSGGGETCGGALHMINIQEPKQPTFAGCFADLSTGNQRTGYTHDNQCVVYHGPDTRYTGREICFNASETAVGIADVTDKADPKPIAVASYPNTQYAHQGWLTEDHRYFYLNDEGDEASGAVSRTRTVVWDMTRLDEPVLVKEFLGETGAIDHNLYIRGNYMYQSNYVAGLRVIDISDPVNPREVGYFDTVPWGENSAGFAGSWSNYPYFKSGTIVVTSIGEGLFVLRHRRMPVVP